MLLLPGHALWFDELFTAEVGRLPLGEIVAAITSGQGTTSYLAGVPPSYNAPYYLVVSAWTSLPGLGGDTSLRVLSLLATAGGLALITRGVTRLAGRATGVLAGLVLACSPLLLEQAVEARSYGLAVLATGGAFLGLVRWLRTRRAGCCSSVSPAPAWAWRTGTRSPSWPRSSSPRCSCGAGGRCRWC